MKVCPECKGACRDGDNVCPDCGCKLTAGNLADVDQLIGMTLAGGCTVGSTWRAGEGQVKLMLSLAGIVVAMPLTGEYLRPWLFDRIPEALRQEAFLPDTSGYFGAICAVLLMLLLWNAFVRWNERTGKLSAI